MTYVTPVYETASSFADQVVIEEPKEQTSLGKIITYQNFVFVNEPMEGIHIIDHTDPSNPTNLSFLSIPGNLDMSIVDDHLYADMFNPHGLGIYNDHLIICDGTAGIKIVDVSAPTEPNIVNSAPIQFAYDVIIDYPHALIVGDTDLYQYDISNLPEMQLISQTPILD